MVTAKRYSLTSREFHVSGTGALQVVPVTAREGHVAVGLQYPGAERDVDLTHRPQFARGGVVRFRVGNRTVRVKRKRGRFFRVRAPAGVPVSVQALGARDRFFNVNARARSLR